jgi:aminopeptidase N
LIDQLLFDYTQIDAINRAQLIDDSFNLGRAGLIDQTFFLKICSYLVDESDPLAFQTAFIGLNYIADMLSNNKAHSLLFQVCLFYLYVF